MYLFAAPPDTPYITAVYRLSPTQLTVVWSPASSGGPSTSFSVSIGVNTSVMSTAIVGAGNRTKEYSYTFTTLIEGTTYTVSVVAINCAGNSSPVNHTGGTGERRSGEGAWTIAQHVYKGTHIVLMSLFMQFFLMLQTLLLCIVSAQHS